MFQREYAARDRRKPRGLIAKLHMADIAGFRDRRQEQADDIGAEPPKDPMAVYASQGWSRTLLRTLTTEQRRLYFTPQPFCTVPDGGTDPRKQGGKMERRDPTWRGFMSALKDTAKDLRKQGRKDEAKAHEQKWLGDGPEPPMPTQAQVISKAGGRVVKIA